jgi:hypothetical protein
VIWKSAPSNGAFAPGCCGSVSAANLKRKRALRWRLKKGWLAFEALLYLKGGDRNAAVLHRPQLKFMLRATGVILYRPPELLECAIQKAMIAILLVMNPLQQLPSSPDPHTHHHSALHSDIEFKSIWVIVRDTGRLWKGSIDRPGTRQSHISMSGEVRMRRLKRSKSKFLNACHGWQDV